MAHYSRHNVGGRVARVRTRIRFIGINWVWDLQAYYEKALSHIYDECVVPVTRRVQDRNFNPR